MKSKAHMKKCLELGVSVSMDDTEIQDHGKMPTCIILLQMHELKQNKSN